MDFVEREWILLAVKSRRQFSLLAIRLRRIRATRVLRIRIFAFTLSSLEKRFLKITAF